VNLGQEHVQVTKTLKKKEEIQVRFKGNEAFNKRQNLGIVLHGGIILK